VRFQVFKNGKLVEKFRLCGAYLFGTDGVCIRKAKIACKDGVIECKRPNLETAGLALLWPIEGFGRVLMCTTCLPEKDRPYNLNLEIARGRLMQVIDKREDWSFFNDVEGLHGLSKEAQDLFIEALQNGSDQSLSSQLADQSLHKAMFLSEKLAIQQADSLFQARLRNRTFGRGCLGCRVDFSHVQNAEYVEKLLELFGFVTIPINWAKIEPQKGTFDFSKLDSCLEVLARRKLVLGAGPLLRFSRKHLPKWLLQNGTGFEKIRETAYQFISRVVSRYAGVIHRWYVVSGLNAFNHFGFNFEQALEMTRAATMAVKAASGRALKIIEVSNPWGEYYATMSSSIPPLVYMDMVVQSGINFDAFALQMRFGKNQSGMHVRDMMQISAILDHLGPVAKPLYVTDVEVPSGNGGDSQSGEVAGVWHEPWSQNQQSRWIGQFYKIALSKPFVDTVAYGSLADTEATTITDSGLLTKQLEPKESFLTLQKLRHAVYHR
jgi:hypothetical protein